jgi:DnaJ-class molecular chaperone
MEKLHTHYDNLKVSRDAPVGVIKAAYKALAQENHPDRCKDPKASRRMQVINDAYAVLSDSKKRAEHDNWIKAKEVVPVNKSTRIVDPRTNTVVTSTYVEELHRIYRARIQSSEKNFRKELNFRKRFYIFVGLMISIPVYVVFSNVDSALQKNVVQTPQQKEAPMIRK